MYGKDPKSYSVHKGSPVYVPLCPVRTRRGESPNFVDDPQQDDEHDSIFSTQRNYTNDPTFGPIWSKLRRGERQDDYWITSDRLIHKGKFCVPNPW